MQKSKIIIRNIGIVLLNIFMIVSLVLVLFQKNDYGYNLYWVITPFLMVLVLMVIGRWSVRGLNADKEESRVIQRSFDDTTVISTVIFGIIYLTIQFIDYVKKGLTNNSIIIIIFFRQRYLIICCNFPSHPGFLRFRRDFRRAIIERFLPLAEFLHEFSALILLTPIQY